jgi:hypothetical protein
MEDEATNAEGEPQVPDDFPRRQPLGAVPGFQPKILLFEQDGAYSNQLPHEERAGRYLMCADLLDQMVLYAEKKANQNPETPMAEILDAIDAAARKKGWEVFDEEFDWIFSQLRARYTILSQPNQ